MSCYDPESKLEVVTQDGYCACYVTIGASGENCEGRGLFNATWFAILAVIVGGSCTFFIVKLLWIFMKLHAAKAFSMKKASNIAFVYCLVSVFGIWMYQWSCFMCAVNAGPFELLADRTRPLGVALALIFVILCGFQITVVWMKLALKSQAKGGALEKKVLRIMLAVRITQGVVVSICAFSMISGIITIMRLFSVVMCLALGIFFHFGGNMLAEILMPKEDTTIEKAVWEKRAEPAKKVLWTASRLKVIITLFAFLIVLSSVAGLVSADPTKALTGGVLFQVNMVNACFAFHVVIDYLSFGVRKTLSGGKVTSFGPGTTATSKSTTVE
ncbi:hypothetical protein TL16_g10576 [Triparma laevis f. inornata]|uniref:Uncharacterized protein n=1 Tax=Triparma laevis f. inornata TaxID=1714386 RepID=A0A9W7EPY9_9STRA|nr:hypothetical protein TL16_g10576 [Triparma laevis f. inornata]